MSDLTSQVSVDAVPSTPTTSQPTFQRITETPSSSPAETQSSVLMDAVAGPEVVLQPVNGELSNVLTDPRQLKSLNESCSSTVSGDWKDELKQYKDEMPPDIRMGYLDVLILYYKEDKEDANIFRKHLMKEIKVKKGPIKTMLYDDPRIVGICSSVFRLLEIGFKRSTFLFIYMTESFFENAWSKYQEEMVLMEAITNPEKIWSVIPVYTEKTPSYIPMELNILNGVDYYKNDENYKKRLADRISAEVNVRIQKDEKHSKIQKKWLEEYKRTRKKDDEEMRKTVFEEEEKTRKLEEQIKKEKSAMFAKNLHSVNRTTSQVFRSTGITSQNDTPSESGDRARSSPGNLPINSSLGFAQETDGGPSSLDVGDNSVPIGQVSGKHASLQKVSLSDPERNDPRMEKVHVPSGTSSHAELEPQTVPGPCTVDAAPSTIPNARNMSIKPDIHQEDLDTNQGTDIKEMTLPKEQVDISTEAEEILENPSGSKETSCKSSKVDGSQQSSETVENTCRQTFESSVNIIYSETEKSSVTVLSQQKDNKILLTPTKPIARTKPQVAHVAPIVQDPPNNDNVEFTRVKTVIDSEETARKVPVVNNCVDDRSQTFIKEVRQEVPNRKSTGHVADGCQGDVVHTAAPTVRFKTDPHHLFFGRFKPSSVDPVKRKNFEQSEATLDDLDNAGEIID